MVNEINTEAQADRLLSRDRSQEPTAYAPTLPESPGDRERGKFRPSFWRRLTQVAVSNDDGTPVTKVTDSVLAGILARLDSMEASLKPYPSVRVDGVAQVQGRLYETPLLSPPGIGTGAAYADLDAIGTSFGVTVPNEGTIQCAIYFDLDDEGLQVDLWVFRAAISEPTDNSALALSDTDTRKTIDVIQFTGFRDAANNQVSRQNNLGISYKLAPGEDRIYLQVQARGALNIAAGALPMFGLVIE